MLWAQRVERGGGRGTPTASAGGEVSRCGEPGLLPLFGRKRRWRNALPEPAHQDVRALVVKAGIVGFHLASLLNIGKGARICFGPLVEKRAPGIMDGPAGTFNGFAAICQGRFGPLQMTTSGSTHRIGFGAGRIKLQRTLAIGDGLRVILPAC